MCQKCSAIAMCLYVSYSKQLPNENNNLEKYNKKENGSIIAAASARSCRAVEKTGANRFLHKHYL